MSARALAAVLVSGALFGFGLALSTLISPEVVLSFLRWRDFGLLLLMGSAVVVVLLAYQLAPRLLRAPLFGGTFKRHAARMSRATLLGSAIFGVGWGLCGVCPGPAIAGLGCGNWPTLYALAGILAGAFVHGRFAAKSTSYAAGSR